MSDSDLDQLKSAKEKLMNDAQSLFSKMYENMQGAAGAGPQAGPNMGGFSGQAGPQSDAGSSAGAAADDVVDGDFREV